MFGFAKKTKKTPAEVSLKAPFSGAVIPITEVPDEVFAAGMLGDGFAVIPHESIPTLDVHSPVAGKVVTIFPTMHACAIATPEGLEVLVHIGLDTVELGGIGFKKFVSAGETVEAGQLLVQVDAFAVRSAGKRLVTPVVCTNKKKVAGVAVSAATATEGEAVAQVTMH